MTDQSAAVLRNPDLVRGCISAVVAAVLMSYAAAVTRPSVIHAIAALLGIAAVVTAYLYVAKASVEPDTKAVAVLGGGVLAVLCFLFVRLN